ncbi:MAG TPA: DUF1552 domain-containing protein [Verrucomicrobiae bacterium]|jgi:hypothetical protein|nr:DUF1552 domain-containing protein [Verrucomicrobiae bacterium]
MNKHSTSQDRPSERAAAFSRRHFLRGLGACLALPAFESLQPLKALGALAPAGKLAATATGAPLRTAFIFFPNGAVPDAWWPEKTGADFAFSPTLQGLEDMRSHVQVMGELDHLCALPGADGGGDHARGNAVYLTGVRIKKSASDVHAGVSIDQVMARQVGHLTRLPSLELSCDNDHKSSACDSNYACAYQYNLSWSSPTSPVTPESNPRLAFERMFGVGKPGERWANTQRIEAEQRSILDFVLDDAHRLNRQLAARDRDKLDQYLTGVREIETRIQNAGRFGPAKDPDMATPSGVPTSYGEYVQLMYDLMWLAFQTDSTRLATFCLAHDGDNRSFGEIGIFEGHHDLSHHQNKPERVKKVQEIDAWYVKQFAKFLKKMEATKDIDGNSLLHNSMIVYGAGNADGNRHTHNNLPIVLAGAGGGTLRPGRYIKQNSQPMTNLFLSLADRMSLTGLERFGDSTGRLKDV